MHVLSEVVVDSRSREDGKSAHYGTEELREQMGSADTASSWWTEASSAWIQSGFRLGGERKGCAWVQQFENVEMTQWQQHKSGDVRGL